MEIIKIIDVIKNNIAEHEKELLLVQANMDGKQKNLTSGKTPDITELSKLAVLKDKLLFHKACKMCLEDLLEQVKKHETN